MLFWLRPEKAKLIGFRAGVEDGALCEFVRSTRRTPRVRPEEISVRTFTEGDSSTQGGQESGPQKEESSDREAFLFVKESCNTVFVVEETSWSPLYILDYHGDTVVTATEGVLHKITQ